jgi:ketosteroid isomerase-like protein
MSQAGDLSLAATSTSLPSASEPPLGERFAATPRLACEALERAINVRDLDAAVACFAPDACLIGPDGTHVLGQAAIRARLSELVEAGARIAIEPLGVIVAGDVALALPTLALRRLGEEWKIAIAAPWGWEAAPPLEAIGFAQ